MTVRMCDYALCDRVAITEADDKVRHLCDVHSLVEAKNIFEAIAKMDTPEYRRLIQDIVDRAPELDDTQRARLGRLLRRKDVNEPDS